MEEEMKELYVEGASDPRRPRVMVRRDKPALRWE